MEMESDRTANIYTYAKLYHNKRPNVWTSSEDIRLIYNILSYLPSNLQLLKRTALRTEFEEITTATPDLYSKICSNGNISSQLNSNTVINININAANNDGGGDGGNGDNNCNGGDANIQQNHTNLDNNIIPTQLTTTSTGNGNGMIISTPLADVIISGQNIKNQQQQQYCSVDHNNDNHISNNDLNSVVITDAQNLDVIVG